ncbi:MAG: cation diffusion facilitator family transporter [Acidimicrobiia bacterium]|nr:cation diffusion facilitator family transporter [Acidimicrobiia bacterium]
MGHGHSHDHGRAGARHKGRLVVAFALTLGFVVVQVVVAVVSGSLALLSDAGHMATDALALGMALAAITLASRPATDPQRTFGLYRLEILVALANALLLFGVSGYVLYEAVTRFADPPDLHELPVLVIGVVGFVVNFVCFLLLREGSGEHLTLKSAYLDVLADMVGSAAVVVSAVTIRLTGWAVVDPIVGVALGLWILPRAWGVARDALRILLQAAPSHTDVVAIGEDLAAVPGVVDVHDLHVWTLTSEMDVASAHLMVAEGTDGHAVLDRARDVLAETHGITHATLQVEPENHLGCDEVAW